jgi:hypothetical protein
MNHDLMITRAYKGNTLIIMRKQYYNQKAKNVINSNSFEETEYNPTVQYHKAIRCSLNNKKNVIRRTNGNSLTLNHRHPI